MKISELAVKNYQFTIVVFLMLIALGVYSFIKVPQAEDPEFPIPIFPIIAIYPGASPADIEQLVVDKVEKSLNELEDIKRIKTEIKDGVAVVVMEFTANADPDKTRHRTITATIALIYSLLFISASLIKFYDISYILQLPLIQQEAISDLICLSP